MGLGWYEGQGLGASDGSNAREGGLPWLRMVQTLARDIHTPHPIAAAGSGSGGGNEEDTGGDSDGGGSSAYEAVATRLAGAMVLTMQDSLVWSLTLPATPTSTSTPLSSASATSLSSRVGDGVKGEGEVEGGDVVLRMGQIVPVICHVGGESHQQLMVLSAKVLSIETITATNNNNSSTVYYTMQFLCDHSIEKVSESQQRDDKSIIDYRHADLLTDYSYSLRSAPPTTAS